MGLPLRFSYLQMIGSSCIQYLGPGSTFSGPSPGIWSGNRFLSWSDRSILFLYQSKFDEPLVQEFPGRDVPVGLGMFRVNTIFQAIERHPTDRVHKEGNGVPGGAP